MAIGAKIGVVLGLSAIVAAEASVQTFDLLGVAPGYSSAQLWGLSADGTVAAGMSISPATTPGFTWTRQGGRADWGLTPGLPAKTNVFGLSGDGRTAVGVADPVSGHRVAFRYHDGNYQSIGNGGFQASVATDASFDGSAIIGYLQNDDGLFRHAARWTQANGWQVLGFRPEDAQHEATAVSADGQLVVGGGQTGDHGYAFSWSQTAGMTELPRLRPEAIDAMAYGVNSLGDIVVGESFGHAVTWQNGAIRDLGLLGNRATRARSVSDDGRVIVGETDYSRPGHPGGTATIWTESGGLEFLHDYLISRGVSIPLGWDLVTCTGVSADGFTFAGRAKNTSLGTSQGFVVTIPVPGTIAIYVGAALAARRRRALD